MNTKVFKKGLEKLINNRRFIMDKIKAFFNNKIVKTVEFVLLALSAAGLIVGGVASAEVSSVVMLTEGVIVAVSALAAFISSIVKGK